MRWPKHPLEAVRPSRFRPPFCPWTDCPAHLRPSAGFQGAGSYRTQSHPGRIPRFVCRSCGRGCSRQTFSTTYYLKRRDLLVTVAAGLAACSAQRQIARSAHCAKTSVTRMADRLGRHALLFHQRCLDALPALTEPVVHDHFETFIGRQDQALGLGTAVGADSWFVYDVDPAAHRGSGRRPGRSKNGMTPPQRAYVESIRRSFRNLISRVPEPRRLLAVVDGRSDYGAAVRDPQLGRRVTLRVYPNPKRRRKGSPRSHETIARDRAMFPADQLHQLLRHTCSDHKRETISFGRRLESILGRAHLIAVWKNFIKGRSERKPDPTTPAMRLGLTDSRWRWERVLSRRLFLERVRPSPSVRKLYRKQWTPGFPELRLRHAD